MNRENTARNLIFAAIALFFILPKKAKSAPGGNGQILQSGTGNGYIPLVGIEGSIDESYLGIVPTSVNRGIRNNNPGNVRFYISSYNSNPWLGEIPPAQNTDSLYGSTGYPKFSQFEAYPFGVRVMIYLIKKYITDYNKNTLELILDRWTPNFNPGHLNFLAQQVGIPINQVILATDEVIIKKIVQALARYENGQTQPGTKEVITDLQYSTARNIL